MVNKLDEIYQTGEKVPCSGSYEVVGVNLKQATHELHVGEFFPSYEGWEVCWHLALDCKEPRAAAKLPKDQEPKAAARKT